MRVKWIFVLVVLYMPTAYAQQFVYRNDVSKTPGWRTSVADTKGLKVVWWNIGCMYERNLDKYSQARKKFNENPDHTLDNIEALLEFPLLKPDVLILGEYCPGAVKEKQEGTLEFLKSHYDYHHTIFRYTPHHGENGLRIFSRYPLKDLERKRMPAGNWLNDSRLKRCKHPILTDDSLIKERYAFPSVKFQVTRFRQNYNIVTTHFPNPWVVMGVCRGKLRTGWQLLNGKKNPTYLHAQALGRNYGNLKRALVIGDFNAPKKLKLFSFGPIKVYANSKPYKVLRNFFGESVIRTARATAISQQSNKLPGTSIDHAFTRGLKVKLGKVIPFAGSDHLAIYTIVQ